MAGVSTEIETVRQNRKDMLEIKNAVTKNEKKNLWWAYYRLVTADEGTSEFEGMSIEAPKLKKRHREWWKK